MARFRALKTLVLDILRAPDWRARLEEIESVPGEQAVGPLFTAILDRDEEVRWRAVTAFGRVAAKLADERIEAARTVMRRLVWSLNEESGNIAWTAPQVFGEILACHETLAREFHRILISYVRESQTRDDNFLELCALRRGAWWGVARLAEARPELAAPAAPDLLDALDDADPETRGLAALGLGRLSGGAAAKAEAAKATARLRELADDPARFRLWRGERVEEVAVGDLAREALERLA